MYRVCAPLVYLKVPDVGGKYVSYTYYRNAVVPPSVEPASLQHHLETGQVEEVDEPKIEPAFPDGEPDDTWTVPQLKAYAGYVGVDIGDVNKKAEILGKL